MATGSGTSVAALALTEHTTAVGPPMATESYITKVVCDSRQAEPGCLFVALAGGEVDGAEFIPEAIAQGAVAVLGTPAAVVRANEHYESLPVPFFIHPQPRRKLAEVAARFWPEQPATTVAVTGTNGKTSTVEFLRQIWTTLGQSAAGIGTMGTVTSSTPESLGLTTPDPITLHRTLHDCVHRGITHMAFEASSHALDQFRVDGVRLSGAAISNLSRDHLDYHTDMHSYAGSKLRLFVEILPRDGCAVANVDQKIGGLALAAAARRGCQVIPVGRTAAPGGMRLCEWRATAAGQRFTWDFAGEEHQTELPFAGEFQAMNVLLAAACAIGCGATVDQVRDALPKLHGVRGRMELVARRKNGATIFVDYAHTPDALETVLQAARRHVVNGGVVHAVFGAGGQRDVGKREEMGVASARHADHVIVTDDNPRHEDATAIRQAIRAGVPDACDIGDRREAIHSAVRALGPGDVLVVAGKGHEVLQTRQGRSEPFDDVAVARAAVVAVDAEGRN